MKITEESFLKNVAAHEMTVLLDNGIYRHVRFQQPKTSNAWFEIVTWPGFLAYSGDMGCFVFSRINDMFEFFRPGKDRGLNINPDYWGEKLEAVDRSGHTSGHRQYTADRMREHVSDAVNTWVEEYDGHHAAKVVFRQSVQESLEEDVYPFFDDSEHEARQAVRGFSVTIGDDTYEFHDSWEWDCQEFTFRFIWCCYALAWSIQKYDAAKEPK